jgi:DNA-directed RNA polymerase II subunit RPB2
VEFEQKGTCGLILPQSDMPFTEHGITPDLIINPNAIPSRMTIGQLIECLLGKVGAMKGHECDGTSFTRVDVESIKDELEKLGYERNGNEYMYNGMTGHKMNAMIFIGPTYYQRLKHLVYDKMHSRAQGPKTLLLRQPSEGRARGGGMRIGEMERDALISHGISKYIKEKLMDTSDIYTTYVCDECGLFATRNKNVTGGSNVYPTDRDSYICPSCKNKTNISKIVIPYAFKLLVQELMSLCIVPRIHTVNDKYTQ